MGYYVRKISRAKWPDSPCNLNDLRSDAIADIRTQKDQLSVWKIDNLTGLDEAALALAGSSKTEKIESISVVWFDEGIIDSLGIDIDDKEPGDTVIIDLVKDHRNFSQLTYGKLGTVSDLIMKEINEDCCKRYTRGTLKGFFKDAYDAHRIDEAKCMPKLLDEIKAI